MMGSRKHSATALSPSPPTQPLPLHPHCRLCLVPFPRHHLVVCISTAASSSPPSCHPPPLPHTPSQTRPTPTPRPDPRRRFKGVNRKQGEGGAYGEDGDDGRDADELEAAEVGVDLQGSPPSSGAPELGDASSRGNGFRRQRH